MEITIKIKEQALPVEVTVEVYEYLDQAYHKDENLAHEQRRHWDMRELDEYIIANECSLSYILTPEQIACRKETLAEIMPVPNACTEQQRQRFFLYALEGMSYEEIGRYYGCSKVAVHHSISAVRKNIKNLSIRDLTKRRFRAKQCGDIFSLDCEDGIENDAIGWA